MNRSVTAPPRPSPANAKAPPEIGTKESVETLYRHSNASIFHFLSEPSSSSPSRQQGGQALVPWTSSREQRMATGQMSLYHVAGSVSFLSCGSLLLTIMPRSQCWCVDGASKFVLRIGMDKNYRIELPGETKEDMEQVENLKLTLQKMLLYERTPCPFERDFDVEIEDEANLDVRKKRRKSHGPAKKWRLDRQYSWKPEGWQPDQERGSEDEVSGSEDESEEVSGREDSGGDEDVEESASQAETVKVTTPSRVQQARMLLEQRSVTAPVAPVTLQSPPPSRLRTRVDVDGTVEVTEPTVVEGASGQQTARLRTFQAIPTDMPPSPPDSSAGLDHGDVRRNRSAEDMAEQAPDDDELEDDLPEQQDDEDTVTGAVEEDEDITVIVRDVEEAINQQAPVNEADVVEDEQYRPSDDPPATPTRETQEETVLQEVQDLSVNESEERSPENLKTFAPLENDPFTAEAPQTSDAAASPTPDTSLAQPSTNSDDPFAAIQARILARRSIGGTTSFHPSQPPPTRQSTSSSSVSSTLSRRSNSGSTTRNTQQAFATAMVKKACSVFLGPPAHLVAIMLRIAARFAKGAFGVDGVFYVESPRGTRGRVPGSYVVLENGELEDDEDEDEEWEEDDLGVPLRSPVRLAGMSSLRSASTSASGDVLREKGDTGDGI